LAAQTLVLLGCYVVPSSFLVVPLKAGSFQSGPAGVDSKEIVLVSSPSTPVGVDPGLIQTRQCNGMKTSLITSKIFKLATAIWSSPA
jgi:hypothetical protein